ncbi:hypothetical protein NE237_026151 [Protea cynaroides]|uniref:Exostosin GT47 domain-containing protein n=1 Tax=Protea cynaroides TaxID=273540 RepID=A0A9Q0H4D5_9MAGN|nr:hypothetical protein NE237_026151 [Protea cynaroides]
MENTLQFQKLCQVETRRLVLVMAILALAVIVIQSFGLPYGNVLFSLFPVGKNSGFGKSSFLPRDVSPEPAQNGDVTLNESNPADSAIVSRVVNNAEDLGKRAENDHQNVMKEKDDSPQNDTALKKEMVPDKASHLDAYQAPHIIKPENEYSSDNDGQKKDKTFISENGGSVDTVFASPSLVSPQGVPSPVSPQVVPSANVTMPKRLEPNLTNYITSVNSTTSVVKQEMETLPKDEKPELLQDSRSDLHGNSTTTKNSEAKTLKHEKSQTQTSVTSISEMNRLLYQSRAASFAMRPRWSSVLDRELLSARVQIENAPIVLNDQELYAPLFRNVSMFKRSYELMERIVKVYVYREGEKPIFHRPVLNGIYASEGWFMKHMEANKHFVVKNPRKAHLFYLPFSARVLEVTLYVPNSHNQKNLVEYLKNYLDMIAAKYPFWNRTSGEDHFLAACHDWAPYETKHFMNLTIRALCNADVTEGFKIGKDVSLPETYVRYPKNLLRGLGGNPPSKRPILAFFAGNMHGYVRPILLQYWENKDPDMKILGPMGHGSKSKSDYIKYMKSSKYCICAKGYEVNSPRVVEAIFYECVPVILSDNFVPPFFEVLDWESFAVFVSEKDIPNLKDILLSIPERRFRQLQLRVKKVQQHFLWHSKPVKYDLFHMTLHSIWYNRVFQIRLRGALKELGFLQRSRLIGSTEDVCSCFRNHIKGLSEVMKFVAPS